MWPLFLLALLSATLVASQGTYAPTPNVPCPTDTSLLRIFTPQNQSLHPQEAAFVASKDAQVLPAAWDAWIGNGSAIGYSGSSFGGNYSRVGIAISGGGYRAAQYGAGVVSALDARNESALAAGTGGVLQVATYFAGLSGGSWLTGSLVMNDWPTISDLVYGNGGNLSGWLLDMDLIIPDGIDVLNKGNLDFFDSLLTSIDAKRSQGFYTSLTDPWARAISYHFLNGTTASNFFDNTSLHGAGQRWSDALLASSYRNFIAPFPIAVATSIPVGSDISVPLLSQTVYEMTPLEFGSWDPSLSAMVNMTFAGTHLVDGVPSNATGCVNGFDDTGFIIGTSASLFLAMIDKVTGEIGDISEAESAGLAYILKKLLQTATTRVDDVASWPNPFQAIKTDTFGEHNATDLELIDGGLGWENVPLSPLFVNSRHVDVIFAADSTASTTLSWPNGTALITTQMRIAQVLSSSHQEFPVIPASAADFISTGTNSRPTFFGCDPGENPPSGPLLVYLPNSPPLTGAPSSSNYGTFKLSYSGVETQMLLDQAHANTIGGFTPYSNSPDANFGKCLQCAAVDRARFRQNITARSDVCQACFVQYCFDPVHPPSLSELPHRQLELADPTPKSWLAKHYRALIGGLVALVVVIIAAMIALCIWRCKIAKRKRALKSKDEELTDHDKKLPDHDNVREDQGA
ncbi:phospholipase B [Athelia psychrophila]|uniref:Lysophospholipase n=1 Tax=Athelia psychrophila TaxID=1759441 RepID=A0A166RLK8_9AGAM|nr:phospholipase B [Fibularhizoctonia sp. CBS 109695]